ncbi:hypothetical protein PPYR_13718 [Photinus pyralis]|uniref:Potassium channel domain-containing protein n=1 Tax=Photinus pyralis TaxID=7054 RepID=A0A5N4AA19_PHOPY|nr:uncharacterized protein LOC116179330 [Photinus pyralis]KAB0794098.1 hypothetical protein PPYR_13718 [Photinus pyralis]
MDTLQASTEFLNNLPVNDVEKCDETDLNKIKALVTPEQILSDTVARKRRTLSKKHTNRVREQTPGRDVVENTSSEDERIEKPKTPERRRKKLSKVKNDPDNLEPRESTPKPNDQKKNSLVSTTQNEILALLNKAKRGLNAKKEIAKRSQSVPSQLLEFDELNIVTRKSSLRTTNDVPKAPIRKSSFRKTADEPKPAHIADEPKVTKRKVADAIPKRKPSPSPKIIEILDPKTSKVVKKISRGVPELRVTLRGLICIFKYLSVREIYKLYQEFKRERWREWDKIRRLRNKCVSDLLAIMIFCGLGGIMFKYVEGAFENFYKCGVKRVKRDFIDVLWYRSHNLREDEWKSLARSKLRVFEEQLHVAHEAGMRTYSGQRSWSFLNGVIYCLTIVTTIGYGHMFPTTNTGMALTIVYAIIGIPLFLIALTDFGKLFTRGIKFVWSFVRRLYYTGSCRKVRKTAHVQDLLQGAQMVYDIARLRKPSMFVSAQDAENPKSPGTEHSATPTTPALSHFEIDDEFNLPISVAIFILVLYIFLGAVMYCIWEKWDFFGSFYFVFISLSTIGFGDYVPNDPFCMMASVIYLVFGLALMSMCINVVQVKLSDTFSDASAKLGATIGLNVNEEDGSIDTVTPAPIEIPDVHQDTSKNEDREVEVSRKSGKRDKSSKTNDSENNAAENEVTS